MRIKEGFILHKIGGECIVIQDGSSHVDFSSILDLNPTAAYLWAEIENQEFDTDKITLMLTQRYEVTEEQAHQDAEDFINRLQDAGVVCDNL